MFPWLSRPVWEARPGEFVITGQERGLLLGAERPIPQNTVLYAPYSRFCISWIRTWSLAALEADSYFVLLKTLTSKYTFRLGLPRLVFTWLSTTLERCTLEQVWSQWHAFSNHKEVLKFLFQDFDMSACVKSSLMPKCLMPTGFFWSWCAGVSLRLLTCCLEKKQKIIRLWSVT